MNDKLDHFVLEYDHESGTALLAMTEADGGRIAEGGTLPYAVARGYDADARTWESIEPFDDVTHAKLRFEKECGRDYVPTGGKLYDDEFITLRWRRKDIADSLENDWGNFGFPIPATEKNVERAMDQLGNHIDDAVYSQGWDVIHDHLDPNSFDLGVGHSVQAREFYEQVLEHAGDYDCTVNIWPAVDGGGVHVSVCPVAHGGNDLAVYSVDADKIGDSAITVRDLEDVGCREVYVEDFTELQLGQVAHRPVHRQGGYRARPARGARLLQGRRREARPVPHRRHGPGLRGQIGHGRGRSRRQEALARHGRPDRPNG